MSRSRNIKPGFFTNEDLAELPFSTRLLYIGLWTEADREGRFEDRPVKLKMKIFPADSVDVDDALEQLQASGFLLRYASGSKRYGQIIAWKKHQNPHFKEQMSVIPSPESLGFDVHATGSMPQAFPVMDDTNASGICINDEEIDQSSDASDANQNCIKSASRAAPIVKKDADSLNNRSENVDLIQKPQALPPSKGGVARLIPDSRFLIPDSLQEQEQELLSEQVIPLASRFDEFWSLYPLKKGKAKSEQKWKARKLDAIADVILADVRLRMTTDRQWLGGYIPHGSTYVNGSGWEDAIETVQPRDGPGEQQSKTLNGIHALQALKTYEQHTTQRLAQERDTRRPDEADDVEPRSTARR
jgi:hypothetical protein